MGVVRLRLLLVLPCAGIGFLFSWVTGFWLALASLDGSVVVVNEPWVVFQAFAVLALTLSGAFMRRLVTGGRARLLMALCTSVMAVGSLVLALPPLIVGMVLPLSVRIAVSALLGLCEGLAYLVWSHALVRLEPLVAEASIPLTGVATALCILLVTSVPLPVALVALSVMPVLSAVCVALLPCGDGSVAVAGESPVASLDWSYLVRACVLLVALRATVGLPTGIEGLAPDGMTLGSTFAYLVGALLAALLGCAPLFLSVSTGSGGLFRWAGALAGTGALLLLDQTGLIGPGLLLLRSASFFIAYLALIHMVNLYQRPEYRSPVTCSLLLASLGAGDLLGRCLGIWAGGWTTRAQGCAVLLVVALLFLLALFVPRIRPERERGCGQDALAGACVGLAASHALSAREAQILEYLARGRSRPYIRDELSLSINTINTYTRKLYQKLGVHSQQELINLVERSG